GCTRAPAEMPSGVDLYSTHCASCHGLGGEGDGPVAGVMQIAVPNLRSLKARSGGVFPSDAVTAYVDGRQLPVSHGDRQMPIWGDVLSPQEGRDTEEIVLRRITAIVGFIEELQYR
ncbi:MAG TPA: cytochrome c, partial [Gammaproteobacteria bacterium]|nr:cytochrome c [Gammaproteobacteria bacterium]